MKTRWREWTCANGEIVPAKRPTMIMYGIDNIRDLFGSKMQVSAVKNNPFCKLGMIEQSETVKMTTE